MPERGLDKKLQSALGCDRKMSNRPQFGIGSIQNRDSVDAWRLQYSAYQCTLHCKVNLKKNRAQKVLLLECCTHSRRADRCHVDRYSSAGNKKTQAGK
jgi:hypothetical protein